MIFVNEQSILGWLRLGVEWLRCVLKSSLALNIYGGILASFIFAFCAWARSRVRSWRFKQLFGRGEQIYLVYEEMELDNQSERFAYKRPSSVGGSRFSISRPVPIASVRAINYLSTAIGKFIGKTPLIRSDLEVRSTMDLDFTSFGGPQSNVMTETCQQNSGNRLARFDQSRGEFVKIGDNTPLVQRDPRFDYGLILKVNSAQFPNRVWIACAGLGERGTSGAGWFLANKWNDIRKRAGRRPFAAVVKVEPDVFTGRDQSAELEAFLF